MPHLQNEERKRETEETTVTMFPPTGCLGHWGTAAGAQALILAGLHLDRPHWVLHVRKKCSPKMGPFPCRAQGGLEGSLGRRWLEHLQRPEAGCLGASSALWPTDWKPCTRQCSCLNLISSSIKDAWAISPGTLMRCPAPK